MEVKKLKRRDVEDSEMDIAIKRYLAGWKATGQPTNIKTQKRKDFSQ